MTSGDVAARAAATRRAFETFLDLGARGRDWPAWSALFTDDAVYTEHCLGQFHGRAAIEQWIVAQMEPVACMTFSVEWCIVEGDLLAFWIWNHLPASGPDEPGSVQAVCFPNLSVLAHDGHGRWLSEEDLYDPAWTTCVIDWFRSGGTPIMSANPALLPPSPSHPTPPAAAPERAVVSKALSTLAPPGTTLRHEVIEAAVGVAVFDSHERAYGVVVHVDADGTTVFSQVVTNPTESVNPCR